MNTSILRKLAVLCLLVILSKGNAKASISDMPVTSGKCSDKGPLAYAIGKNKLCYVFQNDCQLSNYNSMQMKESTLKSVASKKACCQCAPKGCTKELHYICGIKNGRDFKSFANPCMWSQDTCSRKGVDYVYAFSGNCGQYKG